MVPPIQRRTKIQREIKPIKMKNWSTRYFAISIVLYMHYCLRWALVVLGTTIAYCNAYANAFKTTNRSAQGAS